MSYILDALRRAEHDRRNAQNTPVEQVANAPQPPPPTPSPRRRVIVAAIMLVLIAGLAALAYGLWHHPRHNATLAKAQPPVLIPAGQAAPEQVDKARPPPPHPIAPATLTPAVPPPNPIAGAARLSSLSDLMPPKPAPKPLPKHSVRAATSAAHAAPSTAARSTPTLSAAAPPSESPAPSIATTATNAQPAIDTKALKAMPDSYRADFPPITVQVHVYDADPAKCWVLIDGRRYKVGDTLSQGPKIYKIVPQGIVFDWQGQRALYPVGS